MPSPMILVVVFAVIGICLLISGGIVVGSIKKLTAGDSTAKKNIENVGIFMNIIPGIVACLLAAFFIHKARQPGDAVNVSPILVMVLALAFGTCLIISGGIIVGSVKKVSGDTSASTNITRVGTWMNLVPGIFIVLSTIGMFMYNRRPEGIASAASPM